MFLLKKNEAPKALCLECKHLHEPTLADIESQRRMPLPIFICPPCVKAINERFEYLNAPKRWAKKQAAKRRRFA